MTIIMAGKYCATGKSFTYEGFSEELHSWHLYIDGERCGNLVVAANLDDGWYDHVVMNEDGNVKANGMDIVIERKNIKRAKMEMRPE